MSAKNGEKNIDNDFFLYAVISIVFWKFYMLNASGSIDTRFQSSIHNILIKSSIFWEIIWEKSDKIG